MKTLKTIVAGIAVLGTSGDRRLLAMKHVSTLRVLVILAVAIFGVTGAYAADLGYTAASGNWTETAKWTGGSAYPTTGDRAFIGGSFVGGQAATASVTVDSDVTPGGAMGGSLYLGGVNGGGGAGTLTVQAGASVNVNSGNIYIGGADQGNLIQSGGTLSANETWLGGGAANQSYGVYDMSGGAMTIAGRLIIGISGVNTGPGSNNGIVTQTAGTITANGGVTVGHDKNGLYTMSGGTLNQAGGEFWLTSGGSSVGTLSVSGSAVINANAGRFIVGTYGVGTVNQSGGTVNINAGATLRFGPEFGGSGYYNLSGGTLKATQIWITPTSETAGALNLTGGTLNAGDVYGNITVNGSTLAPGGIGVVGTTTMRHWYHAPNYVQNAGSTLSVDLASGSSYDLLDVIQSGTATLGGNLTVALLGGFTPGGGDTFTIIIAASTVSGTFANAGTSGNRYDLGGGSFIVTYNSGSVVLSSYQAASTTTTSTTTSTTTTTLAGETTTSSTTTDTSTTSSTTSISTTSTTTTTTTSSTTTAMAAGITVRGYWRLGEDDPGAVVGNQVNATTVANIGTPDLTAGNPPFATYSSDVAPGSTMSVDFNIHNVFSSATPISTATDNTGYEIWFKPKSGQNRMAIAAFSGVTGTSCTSAAGRLASTSRERTWAPLTVPST
jgi:hypothetical protein